MDPRPDRRSELSAETPCVGTFNAVEDAFDCGGLDGVVIASPPAMHVVQATSALEAGLPVLLEKPVSPDLASTSALNNVVERTGIPLLLGYTWRWWPPLSRVRELLEKEVVGEIRYVQFQMSAHLADWHPWEPYQDFFMASSALGGGALLDESHWIDLALWMFGLPDHVFARVDKVSDLEIDTDDNVDMLWRYAGGRAPHIGLHLDIFGRPHEKFIRFTGDRGSLLWTADPNRICWGNCMEGWEHSEEFVCERNDMFLAVAREFLDVTSGAPPSCTIADGVNVMHVVEAARRSHDQCLEIAMEQSL